MHLPDDLMPLPSVIYGTYVHVLCNEVPYRDLSLQADVKLLMEMYRVRRGKFWCRHDWDLNLLRWRKVCKKCGKARSM